MSNNKQKDSTESEAVVDTHAPSNHEVHVHGPNCNHHHHHEALKPILRAAPKVGRNDPCICGSEKKYKKCCGN